VNLVERVIYFAVMPRVFGSTLSLVGPRGTALWLQDTIMPHCNTLHQE